MSLEFIYQNLPFFIGIILQIGLVILALATVFKRDLLCSTFFMGSFSLFMAGQYLVLSAPDVAITEAAVGAGISTILLLLSISVIPDQEKKVDIKFLPLFVVILLTILLISSVTNFLPFGSGDNPSQLHLAKMFIEESYNDIGIPNIVTSVLASYRGFDTFGEANVIFTAGIAILALLPEPQMPKNSKEDDKREAPEILQVVVRSLVPFIILFALYIQLHGEYSPGGGFQAGVICASTFIAYALMYDLNALLKLISVNLIRKLCALGVLIYGAVGIYTMLRGGNFLDYSVIASNKIIAQQIGIVTIELGIGLTVFSVIMLIYVLFRNYSIIINKKNKA